MVVEVACGVTFAVWVAVPRKGAPKLLPGEGQSVAPHSWSVRQQPPPSVDGHSRYAEAHGVLDDGAAVVEMVVVEVKEGAAEEVGTGGLDNLPLVG